MNIELQDERPTISSRWPGVILLLAAFLLFAHGCHSGDQDNELLGEILGWF